MLSILIPVFNYQVTDLVKSLREQALKLAVPFEIIILDDASDPEFTSVNKAVERWDRVIYLTEEKNLGRSGARNKLASVASFDYILFVDGDAAVIKETFIESYTKYCTGNVVICGGTYYDDIKPENPDYFLRWKYGVNRECKPASERNRCPNAGFSSFNFLIRKDLFKSVQFNETQKQYGHEDTLFGFELMKLNLVVKHIDNPLLHKGLERNIEFLHKTRVGINSLCLLVKQLHEPAGFISQVTLLKTFYRMKKCHIMPLPSGLNRKLISSIEPNILGPKPSLFLFDLYRLLCFGDLYRLSK